MRIAVASSGLGHVARGIETWAMDTAAALAERGVDVTLFAGGEAPSVGCRTGNGGNAIWNSGNQEHRGGKSGVSPEFLSSRLPLVELRGLRRSDPRAVSLAARSPGWAWRWGLKSEYGWEQLSFWLKLWPCLRRGRHDILHVQDPMLAYWCRAFRRLGILGTREILALGTEEPPQFLRRFEFVQHLAPWHLEKALGIRSQESGVRSQELGDGGEGAGGRVRGDAGAECPADRSAAAKPYWTAMPNFVDTEIFRPAASDAEKAACREKLGIPPDALVIGTAATVKRPHKRIDWLVREFAALLKRPQTTDHRPQTGRGEGGDGQLERHGPQGLRSAVCGLQSSPFLAIAGARTAESGDIADTARGLCGERVKFFLDLPRDRMPDFYRALDVFVLVSLFEMMPIAVLEALGSGLPVVANRHPVLEWMVGEESRPQTADRRPHTADHRPQTADRRPQITDCGQETEDRELCGGVCIDMGRDGALAGFLGALDAGWTRARAAGARNRALAMFSKERVAEQYVRYYERVIAA